MTHHKKKLIASFTIVCTFLLTGCFDKPAQVQQVQEVTVAKWGPQSTKVKTTFATQANGNSALWFEQKGIHSAESVEVWLGDTKLSGMAIKPNEGGSAEVPAALLSKPGQLALYFILKPSGQKIDVGMFEIKP
jgi:hypothetical protein